MSHHRYYRVGWRMIPDWEAERRAMVERQLRRRGIRDARVLQAMGEIPREEFVPPELARDSLWGCARADRLGADHLAAVYDGADGAGTGVDRHGDSARSRRRIGLRRGGAGISGRAHGNGRGDCRAISAAGAG